MFSKSRVGARNHERLFSIVLFFSLQKSWITVGCSASPPCCFCSRGCSAPEGTVGHVREFGQRPGVIAHQQRGGRDRAGHAGHRARRRHRSIGRFRRRARDGGDDADLSVAVSALRPVVGEPGGGGRRRRCRRARGLVNGSVITRLRVTPFVATLGMMSSPAGWRCGWPAAAAVLSRRAAGVGRCPGAGPVRTRCSSTPACGRVSPWPADLPAAAMHRARALTATPSASSESTARLCGVAVERNKVAIYRLAGLFAGWAGILLIAHGNSGDPTAAAGLELDVIAAVVIGGASLSGGRARSQGHAAGRADPRRAGERRDLPRRDWWR